MPSQISSNPVFSYFIKYKWIYLTVGVVSIGASVIFSSPSFIPPKYMSRSVMYPSNLISYSSETATEQLLQLMNASEVKNALIEKFQLPRHYEIDTSKDRGHYKLFKELEDNLSVDKTSFESVEVEVLDTDPKMAKEMNLEIIKQVNIKARNLQREKSKEILKIRKNQLLNKEIQIDSLEKKVRKLSMKYGLLDYPLQSKEVTKGYMEFLLENKRGKFDEAEELYENLQKEGKRFHDLQYLLMLARGDYNDLLNEYEDAVKDVSKELTYTNLIISPRAADKKSYPIRWLIVSIAFISSLIFTTAVLFLLGKVQGSKVD